jgi:prophage tail gpP-like protein
MQVRAARSTEVEVKVRGWTHRDGPWEPNTLVQVTAAPLRLDHELLIVDVEYGLDQRGSVTRLAMTSADAYTLLPAKAETAEAGPGAFWALPKQATR